MAAATAQQSPIAKPVFFSFQAKGGRSGEKTSGEAKASQARLADYIADKLLWKEDISAE